MMSDGEASAIECGEIMQENVLVVIALLLTRVLKLMARMEELVDQALYELDNLRGEYDKQPGRRRFILSKTTRTKVKPVDVLTIQFRGNGSSRILANGLAPVELSPRLTDLVIFAASGTPGQDMLASHRLLSEAAEALMSSKKAVVNLVHRLRHKLDECGWNAGLVELTRSQSGSRLRFLTRQLVVIKKQ